jgi:hypothetical protein
MESAMRERTVLVPVTDGHCLAFDRDHGWHIAVAPPAWWLEMTDPANEVEPEVAARSDSHDGSCGVPRCHTCRTRQRKYDSDPPIPFCLPDREVQPLGAA